jgi:hypothetical protein
MVTVMLEDMETRYGVLTPIMRMATLLDPRFKGLKFCHAEVTRNAAWIDLAKYASRVLPEESVTAVAPETQVMEADFDLFGMMYQDAAPDTIGMDPFTVECHEYISYPEAPRDKDPLDWWKVNEPTFPILAKLARRLLALPASSAPSERVFSKVNEVVNKRRNRLEPSTSEKIVFLQRALPWISSGALHKVSP